MFTYRLVVEYDGTRYHGWQEQKNARGVAGELRRAFEAVGCPVVELGGSGRTDAGVHALAQNAHLRVRKRWDAEALRRAVNGELARDVHVLALAPAPQGFHARHGAVQRSYLYQVARRRTAFAKRYVWWVKEDLDLEAMEAAAARFVGLHDFAQLCQRPGEQASTLAKVESVEIAPVGALVLVRMTASHFLWKMVRRSVGTLVRVGAGELAPEEVETLLRGEPLPPDRGAPAAWTAPSSGLFLERVLYPGDPPLGPPQPVTPVAAEEVIPGSTTARDGGAGRGGSGRRERLHRGRRKPRRPVGRRG